MVKQDNEKNVPLLFQHHCMNAVFILLVYVCMCVRVGGYMHACACVCVWRSEVNLRCRFSALSTLVLERASLRELELAPLAKLSGP